MNTIALGDLLTIQQLKQIRRIYKAGGRAKEICEEIVKPNLVEIERKAKQPMEPMYLGYLLEHLASKAINEETF